jgi:hypothetical protein
MACAYVFASIALISLPAAITSGQVIIIVAWIPQTFLQLVLLSIIMVGHTVQSAASDARAANEFADTKTILDRLDLTPRAASDQRRTRRDPRDRHPGRNVGDAPDPAEANELTSRAVPHRFTTGTLSALRPGRHAPTPRASRMGNDQRTLLRAPRRALSLSFRTRSGPASGSGHAAANRARRRWGAAQTAA